MKTIINVKIVVSIFLGLLCFNAYGVSFSKCKAPSDWITGCDAGQCIPAACQRTVYVTGGHCSFSLTGSCNPVVWAADTNTYSASCGGPTCTCPILGIPVAGFWAAVC